MSARDRLALGTRRMPNGCLEWQGATNPGGYGVIWHDGKCEKTHRLAWVLVNGPIPEGLLIRHVTCANRPCCEPTHLRPGTDKDNAADRRADGHHASSNRTHCPQGHPYDEPNTAIDPAGARYCRTCRRDRSRVTRKLRKEQLIMSERK